MKEIISTITSKGQITLPAEVRRSLGVKTRDKVAFLIDEGGTVTLKTPTYPTIESLAGAAGSLDKPLSWDEMRRIAIEDHLAEKYAKKP